MVELVSKHDAEMIRSIIDLATEAFGAGGLKKWQLVPLIRHGRVFFAKPGLG